MGIVSSDVVLEIGPGTGNLTKFIISQNQKIYLIEKMKIQRTHQKKIFKQDKNYKKDILKIPMNFILKKNFNFRNLPYNISTKILSEWCQ